MRRLKSKGVSEIFSTLIVAVIVLAMSGPLLYYFHQVSSTQKSSIDSTVNSELLSTETKLRIIKIGNSTDDIFLFNYGEIDIYIKAISINGKLVTTHADLQPDSMISLSDLVGNMTVNGPLLINANGQYFLED